MSVHPFEHKMSFHSKLPLCNADMRVFEEAPALVIASASCRSLFIHSIFNSSFSCICRSSEISTRSRLSETRVEVLAASNKDLLSVLPRKDVLGRIKSISIARCFMKVAVSHPSAKARVSAASVERAIRLIRDDLQAMGQALFSSHRKTM